jgi:hypothetical protein
MSTFRITPLAPVGSLLKADRPRERRAKPATRPARERNEGHLEAIRQLPCLSCQADPCGEAAHVRMTDRAAGKVNPGLGAKPDDRFALPLCHTCHMEQHRGSEIAFWRARGIDPLRVAATLHKLSPNTEAMRAAVFACIAVNAMEQPS